MKSIHKPKRAQISLREAPYIILVVGLMFLIMATVALIGEKYGTSMGAHLDGSVVNRSSVYINGTTYYVAERTEENFEGFTVSAAYNASSGALIGSGNYTVSSSAGSIVGSAGRTSNWSSVNMSFTYSYCGISCNVTTGLQTNISDNTDLAGVVLTISLVGIILTTLVGVFVAFAGRRGL